MSDARRTPTMEMRAHNNIFHSGVEMDSQQQQFCLKWNSFGTNLATSFSNLFKSETLADVILFCDGVSFKAHKLILAACSKHLSDLFEAAASAGPAAGASHSLLVILDGTSATNMAALLEFMYKGEVHVAQDALSSFLKAAECLQVKGLSIEHEKLAVAQGNVMETSAHLGGDSPPSRKRVKLTKEELEATVNHGGGRQSARQSPSPNYSPTMSPMYPPQHVPPAHYARAPQQQQMPPTSGAQPPLSPYDRLVYENNSRKRPLRSPNELLQESVRASVLRDGSKATSGSSPPPAFGSADRPPEVTSMGCNDTGEDIRRDPSCPEDLRIKVEPTSAGGAGSNGRNGSPPAQQDEPPSSTYGGSPPGGVDGGTAITHPFDDTGPADQQHITIPWNPTTGKLGHGKTGSTVTTPDGKKLKCPFCERLYGYETNLRAHIRQRHQGIRVPCPYCTRTFTRNNTVRRHIAREHRTELSLAQQAQARQLAAGVTHNQ